MANVKIKVVGVLREREDVRNNNNNRAVTLNGETITSTALGRTNGDGGDGVVSGEVVGGGGGGGGVGGGGGGAGGDGGDRTIAGIVRQIPKMTALDLAGILNCRRRLEWTKEWLKKNQTEFLSKENLLKDIQFRSNETYHLNCFLDITERQFRYLVTKLASVISSYEPHRRKKSFSAEERIAITLKYLATGEFHSCRNYCFRASKPVILKMISDICLNFYELLKDEYLSLPKTDEQWQKISSELLKKHELPDCLGSMAMRKIKFHSTARNEDDNDFVAKPPLIFTAIADDEDNFSYVDIHRTTARRPDQIYEHSNIKRQIEQNMHAFPATLYREQLPFSYFVGDNCLPVKSYLFNSLQQVRVSKQIGRTLNKLQTSNGNSSYSCYSIGGFNVCIENALCMLCNIFPIFAQPLRMDEENAQKIILGCVALYNYLRKTNRAYYKHSEKITRVEGTQRMDDLSDDEKRELYEQTPVVTMNNCFEQLCKQCGDTAEGLTKCVRLMKFGKKCQTFYPTNGMEVEM